ncbi:MAG: hypothetical protein R3C58_14610 [Parvularculaceae bacterium]
MAQNALATNVQNAAVFDGVTLAQVQSVFANTKFNDESFIVTQRQTSAGTPYLAVTAASLPFTIFMSGANEEFSGDGDGVYAGVIFFTPMNLTSFGHADIHEFNRIHKFVKLTPIDNNFAYSVEMLAAGGVTEGAIVNALVPFFNGIESILTIVTTQTVSYDAPRSIATIDGGGISIAAGAFSGASKLNNMAPDPNEERRIQSFADDAARSGLR